MEIENEKLLIAIRAALRAGKVILEIYNDPLADFEIEKKADHSPLTIADKKAHLSILSFLTATDIPVLSEEGRTIPFEERKKWKELWIIDPLDGTKEFIKRNGEFTVNIALINGQVPVLGVIYAPVKKELYFADAHIGAFKITDIEETAEKEPLEELVKRSIRLPYNQKRDSFIMVASRSHMSPQTADYIETIKKAYPSVELISSGSSIKIALVAEGAADAYPRFAPTMEWDTAAGHAIVKAAGGEIYQAGKQIPLQYNKADLLNPSFIVEKIKENN